MATISFNKLENILSVRYGDNFITTKSSSGLCPTSGESSKVAHTKCGCDTDINNTGNTFHADHLLPPGILATNAGIDQVYH